MELRRRLVGADFHGAELHMLLLPVNPSSVIASKREANGSTPGRRLSSAEDQT